MMKFSAVILFLVLSAVAAASQSGRVVQASADKGDGRAVKELFDEANGYRKLKFEEFEKKKLAVSKSLRDQTEREQKQLAAKLAAQAAERTELSADDIYYLALLHWIAENLDATSETLQKYLARAERTPERTQTARSLLVVTSAKQKKFDEAVTALAEYQKAEPVKPSERLRMNSELAKAYLADDQPAKASPYAAEAFAISRSLAVDAAMRTVGIDLVYDNALVLFDARRRSGEIGQADIALEEFRKIAGSLGNSVFYYYAADRLITYRIESGRK